MPAVNRPARLTFAARPARTLQTQPRRSPGAAGCTLHAMERAGSNAKQAFLLAAAIAGLVLAFPVGRWLGTPRPISGTAPVDEPKGPPLPLPAPAALSRSEVRRIGAKEWREMPLESGRKALAAIARNCEILRPPDITFFQPISPEVEIRFTTQDRYTVRIAMNADATWISGHEAYAPDGQVSRIHGDFLIEKSGRRDLRDAIAPVLSDSGPGDGK